MIENSPKQRMKSFWKRPEGVTGTIFLIGLIVVFAVFSVQKATSILTQFRKLFYRIAMIFAFWMQQP